MSRKKDLLQILLSQISNRAKMKISLIFGTLILIISQFVEAQTRDTLNNFTLRPKELQEDFNFLRRILTETHPGLYRYTSKEAMTRKMDSVSALLNQPMEFYDFYLALSDLIANVRCAHTYLVPKKKFETFYLDEIKTFPLMIFFIEGKYYVTINGTKDETIKPGDELVSINGQSVLDIRTKMKKYLWADGYNETFKEKAMFEAYFPLFYCLLVERCDWFDIVCKTENGQEVKLRLAAQTFRETRKNFKNKVNRQILSMSNKRNKLDRKKGWRLSIREKEKVGLMRINAFGGGRDENEARLKMRAFMDECMEKLSRANVQDLIIDLRYNGGGWDIQGVELFTYLIKEPARCYKRLHSITDSTEFIKLSDLSQEDRKKMKQELKREADGTFSVKEEFSDQLKIQQPKPNHFTGQVYILANGSSASTTGEFIAYTKSHRLATVVGEESGSAHEGGNGGSFLHFSLPHSKIYFGTPLLAYENEVIPVSQKGKGTLPDFRVPNNMQHILNGYDTQLNFTLDLIQKKRSN